MTHRADGGLGWVRLGERLCWQHAGRGGWAREPALCETQEPRRSGANSQYRGHGLVHNSSSLLHLKSH